MEPMPEMANYYDELSKLNNELVNIQRELAKKNAELKRKDDQLRNSQKLEALGVLAGGIAHEFNNMMGGIYGYIDLARDEDISDAALTYLEKALLTMERAKTLTGQLVTFSKGGEPIKKILPLFPFIQEAVQAALGGATAITCSFEAADDLWPSSFDKRQIGLVVDAIVSNAMESMPQGGSVAVTASNSTVCGKLNETLPAGKYVKLSFKDGGTGISSEILPQIFDPFFSTKGIGRGLGLAKCYSIVNRHGGCIEVESWPGNGSAFHVYLPASLVNE